jgi:hypothetical protein
LSNIVHLNSEAHKHLKIRADAAVELGDGQRFVPVVLSEFPFLIAHYPLLFSKDAGTGAFFCGAVLGFDEGENLFLDGETGQDCYRPLNLRRMPFYTAGDEIAIDLDHPRVGGTGDALFTEAGEPTQFLAGIAAALRELRQGGETMKDFIDTLLKLSLIEPLDVTLAFDDGRRELQGLYTINREALAALDDSQVVTLFRSGYLQHIHFMLASLRHIAILATKKNRRLLSHSVGLAMSPA